MKKTFPRIWFLKKETTLKRKELSWSCRSSTYEAINACWHIAKNVQILSELWPRGYSYLPQISMALTEGCGSYACVHIGLRIEPFKSILRDFMFNRMYIKAFLIEKM